MKQTRVISLDGSTCMYTMKLTSLKNGVYDYGV